MTNDDFKSAMTSVLNAVATMCDKWHAIESKVMEWAEGHDGQEAEYYLSSGSDTLVGKVKYFHDEDVTKLDVLEEGEPLTMEALPKCVGNLFWKHDFEIKVEFDVGIFVNSLFSVPIKPNSEEERVLFHTYGKIHTYGKTEYAYNPRYGFHLLRDENGKAFVFRHDCRIEMESGPQIDATKFLRVFSKKKAEMAKVKERALMAIQGVVNGTKHSLLINQLCKSFGINRESIKPAAGCYYSDVKKCLVLVTEDLNELPPADGDFHYPTIKKAMAMQSVMDTVTWGCKEIFCP